MTGNTIVKEPASSVMIRFQDCDPFGHLNNARYLDYFINARENHLADFYDIDIYKRQKEEGSNWVISKTQIVYLLPVFFRERVMIKTRLLSFNESSILMEGVMSDEQETFPKSITWIHFIYFHLEQAKAILHPQKLMQYWQTISFGNPEIETRDFDGRVKQIKSQFRT